MNREVAIALTVLLLISARPSLAQDIDDADDAPPRLTIDHRTSLIPERWCANSQSPALAPQSRFEPDGPTVMPLTTAEFTSRGFRAADHAALSARLAELDGERLITFWEGRTFGLFFGITEGGYVGLSLGQSDTGTE